ncbi:MAG: hypothetical protein IJB80_01830 [Clostridia bacterium]|nr:hypothetical protein [Clostridia bacterium]
MKKYVDGMYIEMTEEEMQQVSEIQPLSYKERVIARIREVYSLDDELAILRQRDVKPEEFAAYNAFVETIKAEEREETQ